MREIASRAAVRRLARKYNFKASKKLGQNFLTDSDTAERIIEACAAEKEDLVIEIGPGLGALSMPLAERCGKLIVIEIDDKLIQILEDNTRAYNNIKIIHDDILKVDLQQIIERETMLPDGRLAETVKIIGNLPYFITTPILKKLADYYDSFESATIMIQKEVAEKIAAKAGAKNYASISVIMQYRYQIEHITDVSAEFFLPSPNVDSSIIRLVSRSEPPACLVDESIFFEVVRAGFAQRRKTLLNALQGVGGADKRKVLEALRTAGIDPAARAETLGISEFAKLSNLLA